MTESPTKAVTRPRPRNRWLILIAAFKFSQALFVHCHWRGRAAPAAQRHRRSADPACRHLRFNPESRLVNFILEKSSLVNDHCCGGSARWSSSMPASIWSREPDFIWKRPGPST